VELVLGRFRFNGVFYLPKQTFTSLTREIHRFLYTNSIILSANMNFRDFIQFHRKFRDDPEQKSI